MLIDVRLESTFFMWITFSQRGTLSSVPNPNYQQAITVKAIKVNKVVEHHCFTFYLHVKYGNGIHPCFHLCRSDITADCYHASLSAVSDGDTHFTPEAPGSLFK